MIKILSSVYKLSKPHFVLFLALFVCTIITSVGTSFFPVILGRLVDACIYNKDMSRFLILALEYSGLYLALQIFFFVSNIAWVKLETSFVFDIKEMMFKKTLYLKSSQLDSINSGDIISRINGDTEQYLNFIRWSIFYLIRGSLNLLLVIGILFYINVFVAMTIIVLVPVSFFISKRYYKKIKEKLDNMRRKQGILSSWISEILFGLIDIRVLNASRKVTRMFVKKINQILHMQINIHNLEINAERIGSGITLIAQLILYIVMSILIYHDLATIGTFVACIAYFFSANTLFSNINGTITAIPSKIVSITRVIEILDFESEDHKESLSRIEGETKDIQFKNVSFSYSNGIFVLNNLNLSIPSGSRISIVGYNGSGKTTIIRLMCHLYDTYTGEIFIGSQNIRDINLNCLREQIGIVQQEPTIYGGTIRYNISFSNNSNNDDKVIEALKQAFLYDFVESLPMRLDTILGGEDTPLSSGQKQRLNIARILYKNPQIIIFDESTSSLDSESETYINKALERICKGRTTITIAHRKSTILTSEKIAVLHEGNIIALGTNDELLSKCSIYRDLLRIHVE